MFSKKGFKNSKLSSQKSKKETWGPFLTKQRYFRNLLEALIYQYKKEGFTSNTLIPIIKNI